MSKREQDLIDIMFSIGLTIKSQEGLQSMNHEDLAAWIRKQLKECGFETQPMGASWGVLTEKKVDLQDLKFSTTQDEKHKIKSEIITEMENHKSSNWMLMEDIDICKDKVKYLERIVEKLVTII